MLSVPGDSPELVAFLATPPVHHDDARVCACSYHRRQREIAAWDGATPDAELED